MRFEVFENWYRFYDNGLWSHPLYFTKNEVGALAKTHNVKLVDDVAYFGGEVMYKIRLTPDNEDELIDIIYPEL